MKQENLRILKKRFHERLRQLCELQKKAIGTNPIQFRQMLAVNGGVQTAKQLLASKVQSGFTELALAGCLELTMESVVTEQEFASLFTPSELEEAQKRLRQLRQK